MKDLDKDILEEIRVKKTAGPPKNKTELAKELKEAKKEAKKEVLEVKKEAKKEVLEVKKEIREVKKEAKEAKAEVEKKTIENTELKDLIVSVISNQEDAKYREYITYFFWVMCLGMAAYQIFKEIQ